jgi:probable F420-dependent oxidoreductase
VPSASDSGGRWRSATVTHVTLTCGRPSIGGPGQARAIARRHIARYLDLPNYTNNWRRLGFIDDDLVGQGSDHLVDTLVAWGDVEAVSKRVKDHLDTGADHVCIQMFDAEPHGLPLRQWRTLAMAML